jgi:hypothetical protein
MGNYQLIVITAGLALCTVVLALLRLGIERHYRLKSMSTAAEEVVDIFTAQLSTLRKERGLLDAHLNEYFNTFQDAGWPTLVELLVKLGQVERQLLQNLEEGRYEQVLQQGNLVLGRLSPERAQLALRQFPACAALEGWKTQADRVISKVVGELEDAAAETEEVGISRRRKRQSTFLAIHEIRNLHFRGRAS